MLVQIMAHKLQVDNLKEIYMAVKDDASKDQWIQALREKVPTFEDCLADCEMRSM